MKLYSYFRSSAAYRVRIALNLKGLDYDVIPVHLLHQGGQQFSPEYLKVNPDASVPALIDDRTEGSPVLTQSLAIIEYLEETCPAPPLLPGSPLDRAYIRSIGLTIACDIHPLNNLRVLRYLARHLCVEQEGRDAWYRHWCERGLATVEALLTTHEYAGKFCYRDTPTLADCCLVPQVFNAQRLSCDLSALPTVMSIHENCMALDAFINASPDRQIDAE